MDATTLLLFSLQLPEPLVKIAGFAVLIESSRRDHKFFCWPVGTKEIGHIGVIRLLHKRLAAPVGSKQDKSGGLTI